MTLPAPAAIVHRAWTALIVLLLGTGALVASTWSEFGATWDEPEHLAAGMDLLDHGRYEYDVQHPPIARLAMALGPWLAGAHWHGKVPPDGRAEGLAILHDAPGYDRVLTLARLGVLPFLPLLLLATFLLARRVLDPGGALLAVAFTASTPVLLGHAGVAALDVPGTATCLLALHALLRWREAPRAGRAAWLGVAAGLAICTKLSALPFLLVAGLAWGLVSRGWSLSLPVHVRNGGAARASADAPAHEIADATVAAAPASGTRRPRGAPWRDAALVLAGIALVVVLAYGGGFSLWIEDARRPDRVLDWWFGASGTLHDAVYALAANVPLPDGLRGLLAGVRALQDHNTEGHLSYLLGEVRRAGWWYFYPVVLAAKLPLPLLLLGLPGLALLALRGWRSRDARVLATPLFFTAILVFCCAYSRINIGVRHVFVLLPLLAIGAAASLGALWTRWRTGRPRTAALLLALPLLWQFANLVRIWPDYLAWFNEAIADPARIAVDSDLDWGQDLRRLERRLAQLRVPEVAIAYSGTANWDLEPLPPFTRLPPDERVTGWVAISALARLEARDGYDWLYAYRPLERIGRTIDLYYIVDEP